MRPNIAGLVGLITVAILGSAGNSVAQTCAQFGIQAADWVDGQLLVRENGRWRVFDRARDIAGFYTRNVTLVYVVRRGSEDPSDNHSGVIVVKSKDIQPVPTQPTVKDKVVLVRNTHPSDNCLPSKDIVSEINFLPRWVMKSGYDRYHERGRLSGKKEFPNFHVQYNSRKTGNCVRTDDPTPPFSNLTQFSFSRYITVRGDTISEVESLFHSAAQFFSLSTAYASDRNEVNFRTEIRPYRTSNGAACAQVTLPLNPKTSFQFNDFERPRLPLISWEVQSEP